jgi:glutamate synthase domain-containing protein 1/glutamate synthase domain-containing protein 3
MDREQFIEALIASRRSLRDEAVPPRGEGEAEGGCGVIGMAASVPVHGGHLLQALQQMRNRGNGKGGGIAAVGLDPDFFACQPEMLANDYLLAIAYLDGTVRPQVEASCIEPTFTIDATFRVPTLPDFRAIPGLEVQPPDVWCYFVRVRPDALAQFRQVVPGGDDAAIEDELVYQNTYRLNSAFYAATGEKRAFVLSHGKNVLVLKMVGYGDDVVRYYKLEDLRAHVWIGHHRYPTKGRVWHPGGAHPFIGMHEALVHNGDFANYASICSYLAQRNIQPLFLTDTEVAVLVFDLLHRVYGYPLEFVIEALAPTTERDFTLLPLAKQRLYHIIQSVHLRSSPDGPWFFLIAQSDVHRRTYYPSDRLSEARTQSYLSDRLTRSVERSSLPVGIRNDVAGRNESIFRLVGITDTSMLRPQVFALQRGAASIGFAASEKQAIDAALESLAREDNRFWSRADLYWNARGGSHTDGGAFIFSVQADQDGIASLQCVDKFGRAIEPDPGKHAPEPKQPSIVPPVGARADGWMRGGPLWSPAGGGVSKELFQHICQHIPAWDYEHVRAFLYELVQTASSDDERERAIEVLTLLMDRRYATGTMKRSYLLSMFDDAFARLVDGLRDAHSSKFAWVGYGSSLPAGAGAHATLLIDARGYPIEGPDSLERTIVTLYQRGFRTFIVAHARGHRFIGCGLGVLTEGVRIDVYGSPGDYLASGIDGAQVIVHGSGQDQLAQIMKGGKLVVYGDVGQTFLYGAKGGDVFVLGNAAGRPLINAVGKPRVVINGTCLDYLAESFMAGDPLHGGGFVIVNGVSFDEDGLLREMETPYPGGNLFSLASGGAIYIRDPHQCVTVDQLNSGEFAPLTLDDWTLIRPYLEENESIFGIPVDRLLTVDGSPRPPAQIYRKIQPAGHKALMPEEAWVRREA